MSKDLQRAIRVIQKVFDEHGFFAPEFLEQDGVCHCIDATGNTLFTSGLSVASLNKSWGDWCQENYSTVGMIPF